MRQPFFKSDIISTLGYALGNSIGAYIALQLELSPLWELSSILFFCFAVGLIADHFIRIIERKNGSITYKDVLVSVIVFLILELVAYHHFKYDMTGDLIENFVWLLGGALLVFFVKKAILYWKIYRARKQFGDGTQWYNNYSLNIDSNSQSDYKFNREIVGEYNKDLAVSCTNGIFVGKEHKGVIAYKGIPYAKSPVGDLRWKKPVEPEASDKVYEAYNFSAVLPQPNVFTSELSSHPQSEDCLTINIWRSNKKQEKLPVVVYFHGGDYTYGGSANPLYDGEKFVEEFKDLIFVSFNYRFGIFGMMDFSKVPGGEEYADAKNLLFYDQIAALKWIQKNIAAFGGDKDSITIMGDSSGGTCVLYLPVMQEAKGLFKRIISISSFANYYTNGKLSQKLTANIGKYLHVHDMEGFRQLTEEQLIAAESKFLYQLNAPCFESLINENIFDAYAHGAANGIELILGSNKEEFNIVVANSGKNTIEQVSEITRDFIVSHIRQEDLPLFQEFMKNVNNDFRQFLNYLAVHMPLLRIAKNHGKAGNVARYFHWGVGSPIKEFGVFSAIEVPYILKTKSKAEKYAILGDDFTGELLQKMLVQFIRGENPSLKGGMVQHNQAIDWPPFRDEQTPILYFEDGAVPDDGGIIQKSALIDKLITNNPGLLDDYYQYMNEIGYEMYSKD